MPEHYNQGEEDMGVALHIQRFFYLEGRLSKDFKCFSFFGTTISAARSQFTC